MLLACHAAEGHDMVLSNAAGQEVVLSAAVGQEAVLSATAAGQEEVDLLP